MNTSFMTIAIESLPSITGGFTDEEREELRLIEKGIEKRDFERWENHHPFKALYCQGDRDCIYYKGKRPWSFE